MDMLRLTARVQSTMHPILSSDSQAQQTRCLLTNVAAEAGHLADPGSRTAKCGVNEMTNNRRADAQPVFTSK